MDRNLMSGLALAATATLAVVLAAAAPDNAYADDISVDTIPPTGPCTRAASAALPAERQTVQKVSTC